MSRSWHYLTLKEGSIPFGVINLMEGIALLIFLSYSTSRTDYNSYISNPKHYFIAKAKMVELIAYVVSIIILSTLLIIGAIMRSAILILPSMCVSFVYIIVNVAAIIKLCFLWSFSSTPPIIMFFILLAVGLGSNKFIDSNSHQPR